MAEALRPKPAEYYNPRPLILGLCFVWGVAMGFCLFYFSPPKQMTSTSGNHSREVVAPTPQVPDTVRRHLDTPDIADVAPAPETAAAARPRLETIVIEAPMPTLTTEGGLTGRTAQPLTIQQPTRPVTAPPPTRRPPPSTMAAPPPIPELMP